MVALGVPASRCPDLQVLKSGSHIVHSVGGGLADATSVQSLMGGEGRVNIEGTGVQCFKHERGQLIDCLAWMDTH